MNFLSQSVLHFCAAGLLVVGAWNGAEAAEAIEPIRVLQDADPVLIAGRPADISRVAKVFAPAPNGQYYTALLYARAAIFGGRKEEAQAVLAKAFPSNDGLHDLPRVLQLAYGETLRRAHRFDEAIAIGDRIGQTESGMGRAQAAELVSDVFVSSQRWDDALEWIKLAQQALIASDYVNSEKEYRTRLYEKRIKIEGFIELLAHGIGFHLYRTANEQRHQGYHDRALATYDRLLDLHVKNRGKPLVIITGMDDPRINVHRFLISMQQQPRYTVVKVLYHWSASRMRAQRSLRWWLRPSIPTVVRLSVF
ncbi:MAG: hypothetical protein H0W83_14390 [Planctomycetes bacterium]|nr:hypothetical protein [Planctomycetota bacterium]